MRCERCLDVVSSAHPWSLVSCRCGGVQVWGLPWRPKVAWSARSGAGWSYVEADTSVTCDDEGEPAAPPDAGRDVGPSWRIGY